MTLATITKTVLICSMKITETAISQHEGCNCKILSVSFTIYGTQLTPRLALVAGCLLFQRILRKIF
jgi:hypothetical protein